MYQGLWKDTEAIWQLPCVNEDVVKGLKRKLKKSMTLETVQALSEKELGELGVWSESELVQVKAALKCISRFELQVDVANADNLSEEDILTMNLTITRANLPEGAEAGFIHSNNFPYLKKELIFVVVTDLEGRFFLSSVTVDDPARVVKKEIKMQFGRVGKTMLKVTVTSDAYIESSAASEVEVVVKPKAEVEENFRYHPDDLKPQLTLFEQMMEAAQEEENSDDDLEDEDGNVVKRESDEEESD